MSLTKADITPKLWSERKPSQRDCFNGRFSDKISSNVPQVPRSKTDIQLLLVSWGQDNGKVVAWVGTFPIMDLPYRVMGVRQLVFSSADLLKPPQVGYRYRAAPIFYCLWVGNRSAKKARVNVLNDPHRASEAWNLWIWFKVTRY